MKSKSQFLKIAIGLILILTFLMLGTIKIDAFANELNLDSTTIRTGVDNLPGGGKQPVEVTLRDYLRGYTSYFDGQDILVGWAFNSSSQESRNYEMTGTGSSKSTDQKKAENNIKNAVNAVRQKAATDGKIENDEGDYDNVKIYCAAHGRAITSKQGLVQVKQRERIKDFMQGNIYVPEFIDVAKDKFTFNGMDQTYQGLAYILNADLSAVGLKDDGSIDYKLREDARQDAIWSSVYNLSNGGTKSDGSDTEDRDYEDINVLTTPFSKSVIYPGYLIEDFMNSLRTIYDSNPEVEIWNAIKEYKDKIKYFKDPSGNALSCDLDKDKAEFIANLQVVKVRLVYHNNTRSVDKVGNWCDVDPSKVELLTNYARTMDNIYTRIWYLDYGLLSYTDEFGDVLKYVAEEIEKKGAEGEDEVKVSEVKEHGMSSFTVDRETWAVGQVDVQYQIADSDDPSKPKTLNDLLPQEDIYPEQDSIPEEERKTTIEVISDFVNNNKSLINKIKRENEKLKDAVENNKQLDYDEDRYVYKNEDLYNLLNNIKADMTTLKNEWPKYLKDKKNSGKTSGDRYYGSYNDSNKWLDPEDEDDKIEMTYVGGADGGNIDNDFNYAFEKINYATGDSGEGARKNWDTMVSRDPAGKITDDDRVKMINCITYICFRYDDINDNLLEKYNYLRSVGSGLSGIYNQMKTLNDMIKELNDLESSGALTITEGTELYKAKEFFTKVKSILDDFSDNDFTEESLWLDIPERVVKQDYLKMVEYMKEYMGTDDVNMDDLNNRLNNALNEYYHSKNDPSISLIANAEKFINEYYVLVKDLSADNLKQQSYLDTSNAKVKYDKNATYKYSAGPFKMNYLYYALNAKGLSTKEVDYLASIKKLELVGYDENGTEHIIDTFELNNSGGLSKKTGNAEIYIDKNNRKSDAFDYNYPFPLGGYINVNGRSYGSNVDPENFSFNFNINEDEDIKYVTVRATVGYLDKFNGEIYECKNVIPIWWQGKDENDNDIMGATKASDTDEIQALIAYPDENIQPHYESYNFDGTIKISKNPKWGLKLLKVDEDNEKLKGAEFEVIVEDETGKELKHKKLSSNFLNGLTETITGIEVTNSTTFTVTIKETKAPKGYELADDIKLKIPVIKQSSEYAQVDESNIEIINGDKAVDDIKVGYTKYSETGILEDIVEVVISDEETPPPPPPPPHHHDDDHHDDDHYDDDDTENGYKLILKKQDKDDKNLIKDGEAVFEVRLYDDKNQNGVYDEDENERVYEYYEKLTTSSGRITISNLYHEGTIRVDITEISAPEGYERLEGTRTFTYYAKKDGDQFKIVNTKEADDDLYLYCEDGDAVLDINIDNTKKKPTPYYLEFVKYDDKTKELLANAQFVAEFYDAGGNLLNDGKKLVTTDENGIGVLKDLEYTGNNIKVKITETQAPSGYDKIDGTIEFTYSANVDGTKYYVENVSENNNNIYCEVQDEHIYITVKNEGEKIPISMQLGGVVFLDKAPEKATDENAMLDSGEGISGVIVQLYKADGTLVKSTISDDNGKYLFSDLDVKEKYYVTFTYNGLYYENVEPMQGDWSVSSKGAETNRNEFNNTFAEIGSWPSNYQSKSKGQKNEVFKDEEIQKMYEKVNTNIVEMLKNNSGKFTFDDSIYNGLADNEKYFVKDTLISASTLNVQGVDKFARYDKFVIDKGYEEKAEWNGENWVYSKIPSSDRYVVNGDNVYLIENGVQTDYKPIYPEQLQINMGIHNRVKADLEIVEKMLIDATVTVNGMTETYSYNKDEKLGINRADVGHISEKEVAGQLNTRLADANSSGFDVKLKYSIRIQNNSPAPTAVTELVDYYSNTANNDKRYEITDVKTMVWSNEQNDYIENSINGPYEISKYNDAVQTIQGKTNRYIDLSKNEYYLSDGESMYVDITLQLTPEGIIELQGLTDGAEIITNNLVEINGYKTKDDLSNNNATTLGVLDKNSIPGNFTDTKRGQSEEEGKYENDTDTAKEFKYVYYKPRTLSGNVWEDTEKWNREDAANYRDMGTKKNIGNMLVQLIEINDNGSEKGVAQIFSEDENKFVEAKTQTDQDGHYEFKGYIPGNYLVKFTYGDTTYKVGGNDAYYSGENYQSVYANKYTRTDKDGNELNYWYAVDKDGKPTTDQNAANSDETPRYSDAYDTLETRQNEIDYLYQEKDGNKEGYAYYKGNLINGDQYVDGKYLINGNYKNDETAKNSLTMNAYTAPMVLEVEYARTTTTGGGSEYNINNVDFAITKRPESRLEIEKSIKDITITLQDGTVLIDKATPENIKSQLVQYVKQLPETQAQEGRTEADIYAEIDDEILNGATLTVTYNITVTNTGEANTLTYYKDGSTRAAIGYYEEKPENVVYKGKNKLSQDGKPIPITTAALEVVDYIDTNYTFSNDTTEDNNKNWEVVTVEDIQKSDNSTLVKNNIDLSSYQTIVKATKTSPLVQALLPKEKDANKSTATTTITLTKKLTTSEDLNYDNTVEIVEVGNTAGRVDHEATPGNLDPINNTNLKEHDASKTGEVVISDPTGVNESNNYVLITVVALSTLAVGIVLIKKFVLKNNID